jgi:hypothetical protein|tara:strand:+ start:156 stop:275 length:120 start_codon:yes stop_codon:yes gene_type:complete
MNNLSAGILPEASQTLQKLLWLNVNVEDLVEVLSSEECG